MYIGFQPMTGTSYKKYMNNYVWFIRYHLPALLYAAMIIIVSSVPNLHSSTPDFPWLDKVAHFTEYALFSILVFRSFANISSKMHINYTFLLSLLFIVCFAILDEFYQRYIPGRSSDVADILFDLLGSALILFILWRTAKRRLVNS